MFDLVRLNVNLQQGSLHTVINLHLCESTTSTKPYKLNVNIVDNCGINLRSTRWLSFTNTGTVDVTNKKQHNTLFVEMH